MSRTGSRSRSNLDLVKRIIIKNGAVLDLSIRFDLDLDSREYKGCVKLY